MVWKIKDRLSKKKPQLLEISEMRGGKKKRKKEKECWEESKSTNPTDVPHQHMPFVFGDLLNYILGVDMADFPHKCI